MADYDGIVPNSLQPWAHAATQPKSFATVLGRIYNERGHFRHITEAQLRDEIATQAVSGADSPSETDSDNDDRDHSALTIASLVRNTSITAVAAVAIPPWSGHNTLHERSTSWPGWSGITHMIVFGDSYTTTGFNYTMAQPSRANPLGNPDYPGYTASNGPNWVDFLTTTYNETFLETINLAYGGATVGATNIDYDEGRTRDYYGRNVPAGALFAGQVRVPGAAALTRVLPR